MAIPLPEFEPVLAGFLNPDGVVRKAAEDAIRGLKATPDRLTLSLLQSGRTSTVLSHRGLSAVLLRKLLVDEEDVWDRLSPQAQLTVKSELLASVASEPDYEVRRNFTDTMVDVALGVFNADDKWPMMLEHLTSWLKASEPGLREAALYAVELLAMYFAGPGVEHLPPLAHLLMACQADTASPVVVRVKAARSMVGIIRCMQPRDTKADVFKPALEGLVVLMQAAATSGDVEVLRFMLSAMVDLVEGHAHFLKPVFGKVVQLAASIAAAATVPVDLRRVSLEVTIGMAEGAAALARKLPDGMYLKTMLPVIVAMMCEHPEDAGWETREDIDEDDEVDEICNRGMGEEALTRVADAIRFKKFLPALEPHLGALLASPNWAHRYAGVRAIAGLAESYPEDEARLRGLAVQLAPFAEDAHPKVRWAFCGAIGMFSYHKMGLLQPVCGDVVLPLLARAVQGDPSMRVRSQAAGALTNFCDGLRPEHLTDNVEPLLSALFTLLSDTKASRSCKENALSALAAVADSGAHVLAPFYDRAVPVLLHIATTVTQYEFRMLRGRAIDTVSVMGLVVPVDKFLPDAKRIMDLTLSLAGAEGGPDDILKGFLWQAWTRVAEALKAGFAPYLPRVMPPLLACVAASVVLGASADPENDSDVEEEEDEDGNAVKVSTSMLQDKCMAAHMVGLLARDVGAPMAPYVEPAVNALMPLIDPNKTSYDQVRAYAVEALPRMVHVVSKACPPEARGPVAALAQAVLTGMLDALTKEDVGDMVLALVTGIRMCVRRACEVDGAGVTPAAPGVRYIGGEPRAPCLTPETLMAVTQGLMQVRADSVQRRAVRASERMVYADDFDEDQLEFEGQVDYTEDELVFVVSDAVGVLFKTHAEAALPAFHAHVLEAVSTMAHPACITNDRKVALFLMDDVLEFAGAAANPYCKAFVESMVAFCQDPEYAVRQAAVYGIGAAAKSQEAAFVPHLSACVAACRGLIEHAEARAGNNGTVTDNAVCALGKIIQCQTAALGGEVGKLTSYWLSHLPLADDLDESRVSTQVLCARLEAKCPHVLSELPKVLEVMGTVLVNKGMCTVSLAQRMAACLRMLETDMADVLKGAWAASAPETQGRLQKLLADTATAVAASP